jgi:hypothetical protein
MLKSFVHPEQYACQKANHTKDAESSGCDKEYPHSCGIADSTGKKWWAYQKCTI